MNEKILIVDDDPDILNIVDTTLVMEGFQVRKASGGKEAVEIFQSEQFDLVITDIRMPEMNGLEAIRHFKQTDPDIEIIVLTGYASVENAIQAMKDDGAFDFLTKPLENLDMFFHTIDRALEKRYLRTQNRQLVKELSDYKNYLEHMVSLRTKQLSNINEQLKTEIEERKATEALLRKAKLAAESANIAKSEFIANISHEIRTPMSAIFGFTEILMLGATDHKQQQYLKAILSNGRILTLLFDDILDLSKSEAGNLEIRYESVSLRDIFRGIREIFANRTERKGLELKIEIADNIPQALVTDQIRIRQILINLIGNAVKFTDNGYVRISAHGDYSRNIENHFDLILEVADTGIGISEDQQSLIFEIFRQLDGQRTRKYGGTGIGLTVCKRLIEMMNGTISVQSKIGQGSIFRVVFQNVKIAVNEDSTDENDEQNLFSAEYLEAGKEEYTSIRFDSAVILLVEDFRISQEEMKIYLKESNCRVIEADRGETALEILSEQIPDLILMDLRIPGKDGYEIAKDIRRISRFAHIPIIALTASADREQKERLRSLFNGSLEKPVSNALLIRELQKFLPHTVSSSRSKAEDRKQEEKSDFSASPEELQNLFENMLDSFEECNPAAAEPFLEKLEQILSPHQTASIRQELDRFDFDSAREQTLKLAADLECRVSEK